MARHDMTTASGRARQRVEDLTSFAWHVGVYVVINLFLWLVIRNPTVSFWVAVPWGLGVAFHGMATLLGTERLESTRYVDYLEEELRREAMLEDEARRKEMVR